MLNFSLQNFLLLVGLTPFLTRAVEVDLTILHGAAGRGAGKRDKLKSFSFFAICFSFLTLDFLAAAVCLDGSPPAYNFAVGFGSGKSSWLVHIEVRIHENFSIKSFVFF